ncbi:MAG: ABC transporter permease [Acidobacteria bacterium]|nr:ABC transporter permease [Acidobacteriota bacterium]
MKKIAFIAVHEFLATVQTRAFILGLLLTPTLITLGIVVGPRIFNLRTVRVQGQVAIIDPTGQITKELAATLDARAIAARRADQAKRALSEAPDEVRRLAEETGGSEQALESALGDPPDLRLVERPAGADVQREKEWLLADEEGSRHLALIVIHPDAAAPGASGSYGTYDLYVPANLDDRIEREITQGLREAIVNARVRVQGFDRARIDAMVRLPAVRSVTVMKGDERRTVAAFNRLLPAAFAALLLIGVMTGGQALLTATVEEKSSRVIEVLLSAVSPFELMAGKIIGQLGVSLVALGLYIVMGIALLLSFALFGLVDPWLLFYLVVFFVIAYLVVGSLMLAIGAAVNEMKDAQSMMMPVMLIVMIPWILWMPITRDPNSTFSTAISFIPPANTFAMLLRMTSTAPPPWWQVWLSIGIGVASVWVAIWFAAKVFRIGLLMYGRPPNFATLIRWARAA